MVILKYIENKPKIDKYLIFKENFKYQILKRREYKGFMSVELFKRVVKILILIKEGDGQ